MVARSSSSVIPERYRVMICCFLVTRCGRGASLFDGCASVLNIQSPSTEIGHCRLGDGSEFTTEMRNEGMEPFVVTDQATQVAPEPSQFESPPVTGRLFVDEGTGVCEPCRRAEAEAIDVDNVTNGDSRWCEADTDFLLGTVETSGQLRLGERASGSGSVKQGYQPLGQRVVRAAHTTVFQALSQSRGQVTVTIGYDLQLGRDVAQPLLRGEKHAGQTLGERTQHSRLSRQLRRAQGQQTQARRTTAQHELGPQE